MKNKKKVIISKLFMIICIITVNLSVIYGNTLSDKQNEQKNIKNQIESNKEQISNAESEATEYLNQINDLDKQISEYSDNLDELQKKEESINKKIEDYQNDLQNSSQRYSSAEDLYAIRLRSIYENGVPNMADVLLSSKGISDFFSKLNVYQSIVEYDKSMVNNIDGEKSYIDNIKSDIEIQKVQLDQIKYDVEKSTTALNNAKSQKQNKVDELNKSKEKLTAVNSVLQKQADELDTKIKQEIAENEAKAKAAAQAHKNKQSSNSNNSNNKGTSTSGSTTVSGNANFIWPLKGYGKGSITATFPKYPDGTKHTGVDIGVPIGTPVYAAQSGLVTKSKYYLSGDRDGGTKDGYGNTVWISDGEYTVIYGHLRYEQVVNAGDYVEQGQLVAYTASTGNSSGPHLHFEIRSGTSAVNPLQFFN